MSEQVITPQFSTVRRGFVAAGLCGSLLLGAAWTVIGVLPWPTAAFFYGLPTVSDESPEQAERFCRVNDWNINEASGMAMSGRFGESLWLHNDSGDRPRLFLVAASGMTRAVLSLEGAGATDWEDMCAFRSGDDNGLLVADTGDNSADRGAGRPGCRLWIFREPDLKLPPENAQPLQHAMRPEIEVRLSWPGGARDCESVAVDVASRRILLCTKAKAAAAEICSVPLDLETKVQIREAETVCKLAVPYATAMDISPDGQRLAIVNPLSGLLFEKSGTQNWSDVLSSPPQILTLPPRAQGETACFGADSLALFVGSEGRWQDIWKVRLPARKDPPATDSR